MSEIKKANALLKAAAKGEVPAIQKLLAEGVSLEVTDLNKLTPIMLAAQKAQVEVFHSLVEAGANLHALALNQKDLLECAAEGGNTEIIRYLVENGHPIEGHWTPRSRVTARTGHITPLIMAAINCHVDAVRVLLEAGADRKAKFDDQTALDFVVDNINFPIDDKTKDLKPQLEAIAALLKA